MAYWLFKSEPEAFSWQQLKKLGASGLAMGRVRNHQARNNMPWRSATRLLLPFVGWTIVGIVRATPGPCRARSDDPRWECVDVARRNRHAAAGDARRHQAPAAKVVPPMALAK